MVLDVGDIAHGVAYFEIHLVGTVEHVVEHLFQLGVNISRFVTHLHKKVTVLSCVEPSLLPGGKCHRRDG